MWVSIVKLQLSTLNINHALRTNSQHRLNNQLAATALHHQVALRWQSIHELTPF